MDGSGYKYEADTTCLGSTLISDRDAHHLYISKQIAAFSYLLMHSENHINVTSVRIMSVIRSCVVRWAGGVIRTLCKKTDDLKKKKKKRWAGGWRSYL